MRRHAVPKQPHIRVGVPVKNDWYNLSLAEKQAHIFSQLKSLGNIHKQPQMRCLCGKVVPIQYAYRCYECGAFWCPKCSSKHFHRDKNSEVIK